MPSSSGGRPPSRAGSNALAGRRLRDRDELLVRRDEVDLLVVDAVLGRNGDRNQEDAEDVGHRGTRSAGAARRRGRAARVSVAARVREICGRCSELAPRRDRRGRSSEFVAVTGETLYLGGSGRGAVRASPGRPQGGEEPLGVERGHTARARGGDCLAVDVVLHVAGSEDAGDVVSVVPGFVTR